MPAAEGAQHVCFAASYSAESWIQTNGKSLENKAKKAGIMPEDRRQLEYLVKKEVKVI